MIYNTAVALCLVCLEPTASANQHLPVGGEHTQFYGYSVIIPAHTYTTIHRICQPKILPQINTPSLGNWSKKQTQKKQQTIKQTN